MNRPHIISFEGALQRQEILDFMQTHKEETDFCRQNLKPSGRSNFTEQKGKALMQGSKCSFFLKKKHQKEDKSNLLCEEQALIDSSQNEKREIWQELKGEISGI